ncbi:MAG: GAF domain-containing protein [Ignavibacteriae bacterium HGW-Ignavibacteriae-4]|jgi:GAF domain-containing protein|nr:MAG: GAF domain-containing protein [Ignavibacteriae bacterium HGW-Ignavibacteriae-4]
MYDLLIKQLPHVLEGETNVITNFANFSALLFNSMEYVNWVGFYVFTGKELLLGPFQGKPACVRLQLGKGVCGTSFANNQTLVVDNVDEFPGHIACDAESKSEIVIPLVKEGKLYGVLDIDSPIISRFDENDRINLEILLNLLVEKSDIEELSRIYLHT